MLLLAKIGVIALMFAFKNAFSLLVLSGTPVRADGLEPIWFVYNQQVVWTSQMVENLR